MRVVPFADGGQPVIGCPCGEVGTEMGGGFVLVSEAWAGARNGSTVGGLFEDAFAVCDGGWWLDKGGLA